LDESNIDHDDKNPDKHWVALLKNIPETIAVSRRQQRLIREN
jgi:two-component system response regulator AlgR